MRRWFSFILFVRLDLLKSHTCQQLDFGPVLLFHAFTNVRCIRSSRGCCCGIRLRVALSPLAFHETGHEKICNVLFKWGFLIFFVDVSSILQNPSSVRLQEYVPNGFPYHKPQSDVWTAVGSLFNIQQSSDPPVTLLPRLVLCSSERWNGSKWNDTTKRLMQVSTNNR